MTNEEALDLLEHGDWFQSVYNSLPESTANKVAEAIEVHSATTSEPLTLEQLREMVDEPVYLYIYDTALDSGWHIIKTVTEDKIIFRGWNTVYVPISSIGKCFDFYAYPPAHIAREKWEPCECCREPIGAEPYAKEKYPEICDFEVILDGGDEITVNAYNHYTPVTEEVCFSFPVSFCPKCGRPLTEQAWAEMEKRMRW